MSRTRFPAFLARVISDLEAPKGRGSGIVLGPDLIVTCGHVIRPSLYRDGRQKIMERSGWSSVSNDLKVYIDSTAVNIFLCDGKMRRSRLVAVHDELDLVLLKLENPVPFLPTLNILDGPPQQSCTVYGTFEHFGDVQGFRPLREGVTPVAVASEGSTAYEISSSAGTIPEGTSGGPLISYDKDGYPSLAAMAVIGGSKASASRFINGIAIKAFCRKAGFKHIGISKQSSSNDRDGFVLKFTIPSVQKRTKTSKHTNHPMEFILLADDTSETGCIYMADRPLLHLELTEEVGFDDNFTLAHLNARDAVNHLKHIDAFIKPLRLPSFNELKSCYTFDKAAPSKLIPHNLPSTRFDLQSSNNELFKCLPKGRSEWYLDPSDSEPKMAALAGRRPGLHPIIAGQGLLSDLACMRPVFEIDH